VSYQDEIVAVLRKVISNASGEVENLKIYFDKYFSELNS
jgi:hypothetical protein